jgi:hypothetical protein
MLRNSDEGVKAMNMFSRVLICACAGALIAGCGSAPYRSGKGNDHLVMYRPANVEQRKVVERDVVYVQQPVQERYVQERYVYVEPVPAYRVVTPSPAYSTVTSRPAPVTRYYYYTE